MLESDLEDRFFGTRLLICTPEKIKNKLCFSEASRNVCQHLDFETILLKRPEFVFQNVDTHDLIANKLYCVRKFQIQSARFSSSIILNQE